MNHLHVGSMLESITRDNSVSTTGSSSKAKENWTKFYTVESLTCFHFSYKTISVPLNESSVPLHQYHLNQPSAPVNDVYH